MDSERVFSGAGPGGANYKSKGGTPLPRVGPRSQGWDPDHMGGTPLTRVGPLWQGWEIAPQGRTPLVRVGPVGLRTLSRD